MNQADENNNLFELLAGMGYTRITLRQNVAGQLLIDATINEVMGTYLLDTGAGQSVVDSKQADILKLKLKFDEAEMTGGGIGVHGLENVPSYGNHLQVGSFTSDNFIVAVMSLESAWESLAQVGAHDDLFGILGVDMLKAGNALLDFNNMTLYLKQP